MPRRAWEPNPRQPASAGGPVPRGNRVQAAPATHPAPGNCPNPARPGCFAPECCKNRVMILSTPPRQPRLLPGGLSAGLTLAVALLAAAPGPALAGGGTSDLLLVPDSGNDRVWALSAVDGSVVNNNYFPADGIMKQIIQIVVSPTGTLIMTDEQMDAVFEYSATGTYIRTLAGPANGVIGVYGACIRDGFVYFTSGAGDLSPNGKIYRVSLKGGKVSVFSDWAGIGQPRGIVPYGDGFLVGNSTDDDLEIVSSTGVVAPTPFHNSDGVNGINFPQHLTWLANGELMVTGFSPPFGIFFYDPKGFESGRLGAPYVTTSPRGAFRLENGDTLYTAGTRIDRITLSGSTNSIVNQLGTSFRWITRFSPPPPCPADINDDGVVDSADLGALLSAWGAGGAADLDGSGSVDSGDLGILLSAWGPC